MLDSLPRLFLWMQNTEIWYRTNGMCTRAWMQLIHTLIYLLRLPGLSGIHPTLQPLCEEAGLAGEAWVSLRPQWWALAVLWLHTKAILSKVTQSNLSLNKICLSDIPNAWKDWINAKQSKTDAHTPSGKFRQVLTNYLAGLPSSTSKVGGSVMQQVWCQPGKMAFCCVSIGRRNMQVPEMTGTKTWNALKISSMPFCPIQACKFCFVIFLYYGY